MAYKQHMTVTPGQPIDTALLTQTLPSSSSSPSSPQNKPYIFSQAKVEDVSPVNPKLLAKALRPPVTIKSFFKPKQASSGKGNLDGEQSVDSHTSKSENSQTECKQSPLTGFTEKVDRHSVSAVADSEKDCIEISDDLEEQKDIKVETAKQEESKDSCDSATTLPTSKEKSEESGQKDKAEGSGAECPRLGNGEDEGVVSAPPQRKRGRKRKCQISTQAQAEMDENNEDDPDFSPAVKKKGRKRKSGRSEQKESKESKCALMVKPENRATAVGKEKRCPICDMKFAAGTWNDEINMHIDNCLIE